MASTEHFHVIEQLKNELNTFKFEHNNLRAQISQLVEENRHLSDELKENIQVRLDLLPGGENVKNLELKLQAAIEMKNAAIEMWQAALQELQRQEELLAGKRSVVATQMNEVDQKINQVKWDYTKSLNVLSEELSSARAELNKIRKENEQTLLELELYKRKAEHSESELKAHEKMASELKEAQKQTHEKNLTLESALQNAEKLLGENIEDISFLKNQNSDLQSTILELKDKNEKLRTDILAYEKDAKESLLTAEEAILQKKEIAFKGEQAMKEIERLKSSLSFEVEKASLRFKDEIKEVRKNSEAKTKSLMEEIKALHIENSEKQSLFERAVREKHALESKLELLHAESSRGMPVSGTVFDDICKRLTMAEKGRDEFELKAQSLETLLLEVRSAKDQELQYLQSEQNNVKERLQNLLKDFNQASADRIKLCDEITRFKKKNLELEKELKSLKTKQKDELAVLQEENIRKQQFFTQQLQTKEEHYKKMFVESQHLLEAQFGMSNRWKQEVQDLALKSEIKIRDLCRTIDQLRRDNEEYKNALGMPVT